MRGKMIVIEGNDCSGKETQSRKLVESLIKEGHKAIYLAFPMYDTPTGKIISGPCQGKEETDSYFDEGFSNVAPEVACLYYAADRKYNIDKILKYVEDGYYVIVDRYVSSNLAHQGGKIKDSGERFRMYQWIDKLEYWLLGLPKADITVFLHVPHTVSERLMANRTFLDTVERDSEYIKNAETAYIELSELYHWITVECAPNEELRQIEDIAQEVYNIVTTS